MYHCSFDDVGIILLNTRCSLFSWLMCSSTFEQCICDADISADTGIHDDVIKWKHFPRYWLLWGEFTGHRWNPHTKASNAELWCFLWSAPEQTFVNNSKTADLRRHRAHYYVTVMVMLTWKLCCVLIRWYTHNRHLHPNTLCDVIPRS